MKIAVTAEGAGVDSAMAVRFGRAKYLILIDTESGAVEVCDNAVNLQAEQGAGIQTGGNVVNLGVEAVVTGNVGPNAMRVLGAGGVRVFLANGGSVGDVLDGFRKGNFKEVGSANVEGHWV